MPPCLHPNERMGVYLKDFDLAGGRVEVFGVLSTLSLGERVELDPEGDALLSAVLPGGELCADAVHLQTEGRQEYECDQNMRLMWKLSGTPNIWHRRGLMHVCVWLE